MDVQPDFRDLLELFNRNGVEYVVVGAYALAHHGHPRNTGDLDLLVRPEPANAGRVVGALGAFGFGSLGLTAADFTVPGQVVQLGRAQLIANKRATGRTKDKADLEALGEAEGA